MVERLPAWFENETGMEWKDHNVYKWLQNIVETVPPEETKIGPCPLEEQLGELNETCDGTGWIRKSRIDTETGNRHTWSQRCKCHEGYERFGLFGPPPGFPFHRDREFQDKWLHRHDYEPVYYSWDDDFR